MTQQSPCWAYTPRKPELKRGTCTPMFITALFIIARTWKEPSCPLGDEWIRKLWYMHNVYIYICVCMYAYSAIEKKKKNAFESVLMKWMKLEPIIQNEINQKVKHQYSMLTQGI